MPKVSVIIPVYKTEDYLRKCLDSVCNQTLKDIEIICINDCSPDGCLEILKEYASKDERIKIIDFKENKGAACARNAGIDAAQGEYLGFVDSDDFIDLDFYEKLYNKALETGADIVKGNMQIHDLSGHITHERVNEYDLKYNKLHFNMGVVSAIYSTELIRKFNIRFLESCFWGEDRPFIVKSSYYANYLELRNNAIYHYINNINSSTAKINDTKLDSAILSSEHIFEFINNKPFDYLSYKIIAYEFLVHDILYLLTRAQKETNINIINYFPRIAKIYQSLKYKNLLGNIYAITKFEAIEKNDLLAFNNPDRLLTEKLKSLRYKDYEVKKIKVSIIVPVYNVEKYLKRCLNSLVFQTLHDIEIICINDYSQDNSSKILKEFAELDSRIKIINFSKNKGVAIARNEGINCARGEYIGFVDSDDYVDIDFFEVLYNSGKNHNADVVKTNVYTSDIVRRRNILENIKVNKYYFYMYFYSAIYSSTLIKKHNIRFIENCIWGEERLFPIQACYWANKLYIDESVAYHYENRDDSVTVKIDEEKLISALKSNEIIFDFINTHSLNYHDYEIIASEFLRDSLSVLKKSIKLNSFDTNVYFDKVIKLFDTIKYKKIYLDDELLSIQYNGLKQRNIKQLLSPMLILKLQELRKKHLDNISVSSGELY